MQDKLSDGYDTECVIVHISDLHFGCIEGDDKYVNKLIQELNDLEDISPKLAGIISSFARESARKNPIPLLIIFSGDLVCNPTKGEQWLQAFNFFYLLRKNLVKIQKNQVKIQRSIPFTVGFLFVPGNHDLVRLKNESFSNSDYLKVLQNLGHKHQLDQYEKAGESGEPLRLRKQHVFRYDGIDVEILLFDTPITSLDSARDFVGEFTKKGVTESERLKQLEFLWKLDHGYIDPKLLRSLDKELKDTEKDGRLRIAIMHHHFFPGVKNDPKDGHEIDVGILMNYDEVFGFLTRNKVSLVLHGHHHLCTRNLVTIPDNQDCMGTPDFQMQTRKIVVNGAPTMGLKNHLVGFDIYKIIRDSDKLPMAAIFSVRQEGHEKTEFKDLKFEVKSFQVVNLYQDSDVPFSPTGPTGPSGIGLQSLIAEERRTTFINQNANYLRDACKGADAKLLDRYFESVRVRLSSLHNLIRNLTEEQVEEEETEVKQENTLVKKA